MELKIYDCFYDSAVSVEDMPDLVRFRYHDRTGWSAALGYLLGIEFWDYISNSDVSWSCFLRTQVLL